MPPTDRSPERRRKLTPILARAFAELGYRRTTTQELARRCGVQETILYRLWPDKQRMFLAAIEYVYQLSSDTWLALLGESDGDRSAAERILAHESRHQGEFGLYRIIFAGLSEADDPEIRRALADMYARFQRFIEKQIAEHHRRSGKATLPSAELAAWAVIGLGTVANIGKELELLTDPKRRRLIVEIGALLLEGRVA